MIADLQLTFSDPVGESEVAALLTEITKDGKLGQFVVDEVTVGSVIKGNYINHHYSIEDRYFFYTIRIIRLERTYVLGFS